MADQLDLTAIMAEHATHGYAMGCRWREWEGVDHCQTYRLAADLAAAREREQRVLDRVLNLRQRDAEAVPLATDVHAILRPADVVLAEMEAEDRAALADEGAAECQQWAYAACKCTRQCSREGAADQPQPEPVLVDLPDGPPIRWGRDEGAADQPQPRQ